MPDGLQHTAMPFETDPELIMVGADMFDDADRTNLPGWIALEFHIRGKLGIKGDRNIQALRRFHNFYMRRFPVHYFTEQHVENLGFALYFPIGAPVAQLNNGRKFHYLVAISEKDKKMTLFHKKYQLQAKTRHNFYKLTQRWLSPENSRKAISGYDIEEILKVCENPESLVEIRRSNIDSFIRRAQKKLKRMKLERPFEGHWDDIRDFMEERDRRYICDITERIRTKHMSFEAAKQAAKVCKDNVEIYNWMMSAPNPTALRNRTQLADASPWLTAALANEETAGPYKDIEKAVDEGLELTLEMQDLFSQGSPHKRLVKEATIKKLLPISLGADLQQLDVIRPLIQDINAHIPHLTLDDATLRTLRSYKLGTDKVCEYIQDDFINLFSGMSAQERHAILRNGGMPGNVILYGRPKESKSDSDYFSATAYGKYKAKQFNDTVDYMQAVYQRLVLPYFTRRATEAGYQGVSDDKQHTLMGSLIQESFTDRNWNQQPHAPYMRPFGNMSFLNIVDLSVDWHDRQEHYATRVMNVGVNTNVTWPTLTAPVTMTGDVLIKELSSKKELIADAKTMGNCIADYGPRCLGQIFKRNGSRFYSHMLIVAPAKGRRAVMEVFEPYYDRDKKLTFGSMEHKRAIKDVENLVDPKSPEYKAGIEYVEQINSGKLKVNWDWISQVRSKSQIGLSGDAVSRALGFNVYDKDQCAETYRKFQPYLPERYRHYSYDEWIVQMGFDKEADRMFPAASPHPKAQNLATLTP